MGCGGVGACITSKMYCGGLLYPDVLSAAFADVGVTLEDDGADCATLLMQVKQAIRAAAKKQVELFCVGIVFPSLDGIPR